MKKGLATERSTEMKSITNSVGHVFFVTSWGYAGDHWFSWFVKALNSHPEILCYLANEGSRPKYFPEERSRAERPDLVRFCRFLADIGMTYEAIGDCYSYRPTMMSPIREKWEGLVPIVQLTRHPVAWLNFHVDWRSRNMRMLGGEWGPIQHEFDKACNHDLFKSLDLLPYDLSDIEVWATYQGMERLNDVVADLDTGIRHYPLERVVFEPSLFREIAGFLTSNRVTFDDEILARVYSHVWRTFRGEERVDANPKRLLAKWPEWKHIAFEKIVSKTTMKAFQSLGYVI